MFQNHTKLDRVIHDTLNVLLAVHFTAGACQQFIQMTIVNYFHECEYNKADLLSSTKDAFQEDWMSPGTEDVNFRSYIFVDNDLQTCGFSSIDKLCADHVGGRKQ